MLAVVLGRARNSSARSADAGSIRLGEHCRKANVRVNRRFTHAFPTSAHPMHCVIECRRWDSNPHALAGTGF